MELTRAALRRAWTSDPAIRDFIGIADNQWDFNDPNGISGFGPLDATEIGVTFSAQIPSTASEMPDLLAEKAMRVEHLASNAACTEQSEAGYVHLDARQSHPDDSVATSSAMAEEGAGTNAAHGVENTMRPALVAVMGAPCQTSAAPRCCR